MNSFLTLQILIYITLYIGYGLYYMNRKAVVQMAPFIVSSTNLTKDDIGLLITTQNLAYTFGKFFSGFMADMFSCRILFGSGLILTSLVNMCFYKSLKKDISIYLLTLANGLAQGPSWPAAVKILQNWTPKTYFSTAWCILSTSSNVFGALGSFIFTIFSINYHWSYGLLIPGCISMTFSYLALLFLRNKPSDAGFANFKHVKKDEKKKVNNSSKSPNIWFTIKQLFKYPYFIVLLFITFNVNLVKIVYSDWTQFYLIKVKNINSLTANWFISSYEIGGLVSSIVSGIIMDYLLHLKEQNKIRDKNPRVTILLIYNFISLVSFSVFAHMIHQESNVYQLISTGFFSGFAIYGPTTLLGVIAIEFTPCEISGTSHAIVSLASNIAAIIAGYPFSIMVQIYSWNLVFVFIQVLITIGIICLILSRNFQTKFMFNVKKSD